MMITVLVFFLAIVLIFGLSYIFMWVFFGLIDEITDGMIREKFGEGFFGVRKKKK